MCVILTVEMNTNTKNERTMERYSNVDGIDANISTCIQLKTRITLVSERTKRPQNYSRKVPAVMNCHYHHKHILSV